MVGARLINIEKVSTINHEDQEVSTFRLSAGDTVIHLTNYGATLMSIEFPDRNGKVENVIAGLKTVEDYFQPHPYLGSIVGRYANRIANGKVTINGQPYQLTQNDQPNHLHGGVKGFHTKVWTVESTRADHDKCSVDLSLLSLDGDEGYPGTVTAKVRFTLTRFNELRILYQATTSEPTPINLTSHPYFNLSGFNDDTIYDHKLKLNATFITEKNEKNIPTGKLIHCSDTPLDFIAAKNLGTDIDLLISDRGYDHNFAIDGDGIRECASLFHGPSGRKLTVHSDQPGLQVYTANSWDQINGVHKKAYCKHAAVALETQNFPDAPNHKNFPDSILLPGLQYKSHTIYRFSIDEKH